MKRIIYITVILSLLLGFSAVAEEFETTAVKVNGSLLVSDVPAVIINGRTYLPLRAFLNAIGVGNESITWWEKSQSVEIRHKDTHILMILNAKEVIVNDSIYHIDAPAFETNGRTLVPVRFLSETLNCTVNWDEEAFMVDITTKNKNITKN